MRGRDHRMLCTRCFRVGVPDTFVPGSDRLELLAWCCVGVPGLLYCAWRHLEREKRCADCGSPELIREARASQRVPAAPGRLAVVRSRGECPWPPALRAPRERMRRGGMVAAAGLLGLLAGCLEGLGAPGGSPSGLQAGSLLGMTWVLAQAALLSAPAIPWRAWDAQGHELCVEVLPDRPSTAASVGRRL